MINNDKRGNGAILGLVTVIIVIGMITAGALAWYEWAIKANPEFNTEVHSYVDQAYWVNDPVYIKENLTKAVEGMRELGLTDDMSWKFWSWDQVPSECMKAQYGQIQSIINQCDQAIAMNKSDYSYQPLITQIHQTICTPKTATDSGTSGGNWCDEVARGAYMLNFHPFPAWQIYAVNAVLIGILALAWIMAAVFE